MNVQLMVVEDNETSRSLLDKDLLKDCIHKKIMEDTNKKKMRRGKSVIQG